MKKLFILLALLVSTAQAQDFRHRYFQYSPMLFTPSTLSITGNTADGADNQSLYLAPGGAVASTRGAYIQAFGNEAASTGQLILSAGAVSGGTMYLDAPSSTGQIDIRINSAANVRWSFDKDGNILQNATNGGNIVMAKANTGVITGVAAIPADVTDALSSWRGVYTFGTTGYSSALARGTADGTPTKFAFIKSRKTDGTADTAVSANDGLGSIDFWGANGSAFTSAAEMTVEVDGTPGAGNDMPGRFVFKVSPDGSATPAEALRITSQGTTLVKGVAVASLPASCAPGSLIRATDSNDCAAGGGDGALCICAAAGTWALANNY